MTTNSRVGRSYPASAGPMVRVYGAAHRSAGYTKELASWNPLAGSADSDLLGELSTMVPRSRDIMRNNGIAAGSLTTLNDNIIGTGHRLVAAPDHRTLGWDWKKAEEWSRTVETQWREYAETTEIDAAGTLNFDGLCSQILRAWVMNGEHLALPLWLPRRGSRHGTRFQLIEADRLSNPNDEMDTDRRRGGIEIDEYGRPLAYWIRTTHPGDSLGMLTRTNLAGKWERIPRETEFGRLRVLHIHDKERTGQTRGKPLFAAVLSDFKTLDHYQRMELSAAIVNAMIAAFVHTPMDSMGLAQMFGGDPASPQFQDYLANRREYIGQLKGGAVIPLYPGDSVTSFTPSRPATAFEGFVSFLSRQIGGVAGLPLELLLKDFTKSNYSSARAALLEAWRGFAGRRKWLAQTWMTPAYCLWLEERVNDGTIEAPNFYRLKFAYTRCRWIGPGRGWIDPVKEAQAARERMDAGISTLEAECAEQGLDYQDVLEQRMRERVYRGELLAVEREELRRLGLTSADLEPQQQQRRQQQQEQTEQEQAA